MLPIHATRTISFTTDEGTYMDVDISPDGKWIIFDLLGDLYTIPEEGGVARQITKGLAVNTRPVWSPDGKKIAYISDSTGALRLNIRNMAGDFHMAFDKSYDQYRYKQDPIWTPDNHFIYLGNDLYDIAFRRNISENSIKEIVGFSSDGRIRYFKDSGKIFREDNFTGKKTALTDKKNALGSGNLSPDGRYWIHATTDGDRIGLAVDDLTNDKSQILIASLFENSSYKADMPLPHFSFSADSKFLYIGYKGKIHRINIGSGEDKIIPFKAKIMAELGPLDDNSYRIAGDSFTVKYIRSAVESPDNKTIAFCALNKIYLRSVGSNKVRKLVEQDAGQFQPAYSPDGHSIAFVTWNDSEGGSVWVIPAEGGVPEKLTNEMGLYQHPAWSPDGKSIAVVKGPPKLLDRDDPGIGQLMIISVGDRHMKMVMDNVPLWNNIAFSPSGDQIYFDIGEQHQDIAIPGARLASIDTAGQNCRVLAVSRSNTNPSFYQQISISPDKRYIVFVVGEDLHLVAVKGIVNPSIMVDADKPVASIRFAAGVDPRWQMNGKKLSWNYANHFYTIDPDKIIDKAEKNARALQIDVLRSPVITSDTDPDTDLPINLSERTNYASGTITLRNARIITMLDSQVIENGTIVIRNGRIEKIGSAKSVSAPVNTFSLDLDGATVMPGLIDLHSHSRVPSEVFPQQSWVYMANLAYGATTLRDPSLSLDSYGYSELLSSGKMLGSRLFTVGRSVNPEFGIVCNSLADARRIVKKRKLFGGIAVKQYMLEQRIQRQYLLMACREEKMNMTNEGDGDPLLYMGMIRDGSTGVEHNPIWGHVYKDVLMLVAKSGTVITPALQVVYGAEAARNYFDYKYWRQPDAKLKRFTPAKRLDRIVKATPKDSIHMNWLPAAEIDAAVRKLGGKAALGSHGEDQGIGVHNELWALQMGGLSNMEALQAATIIGAKGLGLSQDLGSIEKGKIADLIILNKSPLEDIHNSRDIKYVMKYGNLYDANTLDQIWPVKRQCPAAYGLQGALKDE